MHKSYNRRGLKKQRKLIIFCSFALLFCLSTIYAAFSTNINLSVKGNVKDITVFTLKDRVVTSFDGLYKDIYEDGRYIYRGSNPDNYILFNDSLWRIVSIESDNTLKLMKNDSIGMRPFDEAYRRNNSDNTYCGKLCNAWAKTDGIYSGAVVSGTVKTDSSLNSYLNNEYINTILDSNHIVSHDFYVGGVGKEEDSIESHLKNEKRIIWNGKVGLITVTDFLMASLNDECTSIKASKGGALPCSKENYLVNGVNYRIINPSMGKEYESAENRWAWYVDELGSVGDNVVTNSGKGGVNLELDIFPVIYLDSSIILHGRGTYNSPFRLAN